VATQDPADGGLKTHINGYFSHGLHNLLLPVVIAVLGGRCAKAALCPFQIYHWKNSTRRRPGFKHAPALVQTSNLFCTGETWNLLRFVMLSGIFRDSRACGFEI